ncbi:sirohydrochlorin chelatase [Rummeliibacillus pycnus]|uniref:sirohydrochlorin chelatase n=1 Tax=Rummeliibacillus pycnus TaxID=101070 RepID=UPI000C9A90AD|nr:sirohydrochlorin chelatase [Rummeliibacillus pycnus]
MKAILFVGHGSRLAEGNEEVINFVEQIKPTLNQNLLVESCFLEFATPDIAQGIDNCVAKGATEIHVVPIILLQAGHSKIHIPAAIDEGKRKYPNINIVYARPLGVHEGIFEILKERLIETEFVIEEKNDDTAILLIGRGGSDVDANSDFYKISRMLWEQLDVLTVECAFMGVTYPTVDEGMERCVKLGAKKIIMLPYFLFTGILMERMQEMRERFASNDTNVEVKLATYFGYHPTLKTVLKDRIEESLKGEVKMNCDTCEYRLNAAAFVEHHHHHEHDHEHGHHHDHDHHDHHHENLVGVDK